MAQREKIRHQFEMLKSFRDESDKEAYLQQLKKDIEGKTKEEWIESMKAIKELLGELHAEVLKIPVRQKEQILVTPSSDEEASLIKALLKKMNVPFKSKNTKDSKAVA